MKHTQDTLQSNFPANFMVIRERLIKVYPRPTVVFVTMCMYSECSIRIDAHTQNNTRDDTL